MYCPVKGRKRRSEHPSPMSSATTNRDVVRKTLNKKELGAIANGEAPDEWLEDALTDMIRFEDFPFYPSYAAHQ